MEIGPDSFGLAPSPAGAIAGGDPAHNASIIRAVLSGQPHPARNALLLNAAGCLALARNLDPREAATLASEALDGGGALETLDAWAADTRRLAS
jgi:anthranilate phosphoribosyltransferase